MIVEIHGLEVCGRHGVGEAERRDGQSLLFDVTLEVSEPEADAFHVAQQVCRAIDRLETGERGANSIRERDRPGRDRAQPREGESDRDAIEREPERHAVRECVRETSDAVSYKLLESLAAATAEAIAARFPAARSVTVRVRKPGVKWAGWTAATASRPRSSPR